MTKKILYIMHLDWKYIKQRPHFIAEGLSDFYDVNIIYFYSKLYLFRNSGNKTPNDKKINIKPAFRLPFYENNLIFKLNRIYMRLYFNLVIKKYKPDFIWITFPLLFDYIPPNNCKLIYDCMDNITPEYFEEKFLKRILNLEIKLLQKADLVFVSSESLSYEMNKRQKCQDKLFIIKNAFDGQIKEELYNNKKKSKIYKIGYVGTISSNFDFDLLENSLKKFDNIEYHIIGPVDNKKKLNLNKKIKFYGAIKHNQLFDKVDNFDAMIMPFKLDECIKFVDPVKMYEYINYNKPIISIFFNEIKRYNPFVSFYSNKEQFNEILKELIVKKFEKKYSDNDRIQFLKTNTWNDRVEKIVKSLKSIENKN